MAIFVAVAVADGVAGVAAIAAAALAVFVVRRAEISLFSFSGLASAASNSVIIENVRTLRR